MRRLALAVLALAACSSPSKKTPARDAPAEARRQDAAAPAGTLVHITAAEAAKHGLPPIGVSLDVGWEAMQTTRFPGERTYLVVSGPPGGPLSLTILDGGSARDDAGLRALVERELGTYGGGAPEIGDVAQVFVAGGRRRALAFVTGTGALARTGHCAVLVPIGTGALVFHFMAGIGDAPAPGCAGTLAHEKLAPIARSLRID